MEVKNAYIAVGQSTKCGFTLFMKKFLNFASLPIYPENRKKLSLKAEFGTKSA